MLRYLWNGSLNARAFSIPSTALRCRARRNFSSAPPPSPSQITADKAVVQHRFRRPIVGAASTMGVGVGVAARSPVAPERPPHHRSDGSFQNPWASYADHDPLAYISRAVLDLRKLDTYQLPVAPVAWDVITTPPIDDVQGMWIGHATFLVQLGGWNCLTDPMFSRRASPTQLIGPARFTPAACAVDDLPPIHFVLLSHSHYDHLDGESVRAVLAKEKHDLVTPNPRGHGSRRFTGTLWVCPLRVRPLLECFGVPADQIVELDWYDSFTPALHDPPAGAAPSPSVSSPIVPNALAGMVKRGWHPESSAAVPPELHASAPTIVCVPAQHQSARTPFDRNNTLWGGFVVLSPRSHAEQSQHDVQDGAHPSPHPPPHVSFYFSGDTGYRSVPEGVDPLSSAEEAVPVCPAFREIGALFGPLDLALLPIGAYSPRWFLSSFHCTPEDAVAMHLDLRARRSVAMHWGTFPLTDEPIEEPPVRLAAACVAKGVPVGEFVAVRPGSIVSATAGPVQGASLVVESRTIAGDKIAATGSEPSHPRPTLFERLRAYL